MNREEFLRQFREALEGKVSEQVISENIAYYRNYIDSQVNSGKSESETLRELGDPRLLAKTIEESSKFTGGREYAQGGAYSSAGYEQNSYNEYRYGESENKMRSKVMTIPAWAAALIALIVIALLVTAAFHVFMFFLPAIIVGVAAMLVYRVLRSILK